MPLRILPVRTFLCLGLLFGCAANEASTDALLPEADSAS